jgi:hypothetical protein
MGLPGGPSPQRTPALAAEPCDEVEQAISIDVPDGETPARAQLGGQGLRGARAFRESPMAVSNPHDHRSPAVFDGGQIEMADGHPD